MTASNLDHAPKIKVAVVDDHPVLARGLAAVLSSEDDFDFVGIATTCELGIELVRSAGPDVVIMDYQLPDGDGATATTMILSERPETKIIMFSSFPGDELLGRAIEAGCAGFLPKDRPSEELIVAVRAASRGESLIPTAALASLISTARRSEAAPASDLTAREQQILALIAEGASTASISSQLFVSGHTVRNHVRNILTKLGAHTKLEAVAMARRAGMLDVKRAV